MADRQPADQPARDDALDPARSFITQAPAGSGKTGLLTQRYLRLLARVQAPEEIIAITFTRKAAGEMQARILEALEQAATRPAPDAPHARRSWECAREALARDRELGWSLLANPARLRVQTIDSLCAALARQMPLLSRFGAVPQTVEDARPLCIEAARRTIAELETEADWSAAIAHLVRHLDNRLDYLQSLIATMLERREQWLRHVADRDHPSIARENLEATLARVVEESLARLREQWPQAWREPLLELVRFAAAQLADTDSPIAACADLSDWPAARLAGRDQWEGLAELLLTREGEWRKQVNKRQGFPAQGDGRDAGEKALFKERKGQMGEWLALLREHEDLRLALAGLRQLPPHRYRDEEWVTLQALFDLLPLSVAQLYLVFQERGQVDFTAMARAAIEALGTDEAPTDLALALDYRIHHLLVDEFQDTSLTQYALLERLTAGWQPGDGRTLFLVGDPMQSIYRFREAEVGLFLKARHQGIGQVPLEFLRLSVNFRSQAGVVDWVNRAFPCILPREDRVAEGAVSYAASTAFHGALEGVAVSVHPFLGQDVLAEAERVLALIQAARSEQPQGRVAVLVRGRGHLVEIVAALRARGLAFRAVEIERLGHRPVIQDLLALTRALEHPADRIAWLAVLRAPWCGLALADLHALAGADTASPLPSLLAGHGDLALSDDGRARLQRVWPVLEMALAQRQRSSLRAAVEGVWLSLGGPACLTDATDLEDAEVFLRLLEELEEHGHGPDPALLEQRVARLFALPDVNAGDDIQLMTIHKSKGLEFDTVILPGLGRQTRGDEATLLDCLERPREPEASDLLLAPIKAVGEDQNPIGAYLKGLSRQKGEYEDGRLLYVAATRARRRLHLLGHVEVKERPEGPMLGAPRAGSLLQRLWPVVEVDFQAALAGRDGATAVEVREGPATAATGIRRLPLDWPRPAPPPPPALVLEARIPEMEEPVEFTWAGETARHVGTVVHRFLQHFAAAPPAAAAVAARYRDLATQWLRGLGVPGDHLQAAVDRTLEALETVLADGRGRWILDPGHQEARNEFALSGVLGGRLLHVILDRTFVDAEGIRWIIDYKTGGHSGGGVDDFLDREQERYRAQLERYAALLQRLDPRPIRLGLYFPLMAAWREWGFMEEGSDS